MQIKLCMWIGYGKKKKERKDDWCRMVDIITWKILLLIFFEWAKQVWLQSHLIGHSAVGKNEIKSVFIYYFRKATK